MPKFCQCPTIAVTVYLVPFAELQQIIVAATPTPFRVILYRRMMTRIAQRVAAMENAEALVTGESLAQVASQTLQILERLKRSLTSQSYAHLSAKTRLKLSKRHNESVLLTYPYDHTKIVVHSLYPKHPATRASLTDLADAESGLDIDTLVEEALNNLQKRVIG